MRKGREEWVGLESGMNIGGGGEMERKGAGWNNDG